MKTPHLIPYSIVFVVIQLLISNTTDAQDQVEPEEDLLSMSLEDLMSVKVSSATKNETLQIEIPQSISTLTRAEIDRIPANNIGELVERLVGVNTVRIQTGQNVVTTRGSNAFSPAKLLILIDGQAIDPTVFSTTWWELIPVSISMIERIEFVRSPGTIYGANAENGVVNIITRTLSDADRNYQIDGGVRYGQQNLLKADLNYLATKGKVTYRLSTALYQVDAYENSNALETPGQKVNDHGEQAFTDDTQLLNLQTVNFGMQVDFDKSKLDIGVGYKNISRAQGRVPDRLCLVNLSGSTNYNNIRYSFDGLGGQNSIMIGVDNISYTFEKNDNVAKLADAGLSQTNLNVTYDYQRTMKRHNLLFGLNYKAETAKNKTGIELLEAGKVQMSPAVNFYFQDQWQLNDQFSLYYGGLLSNHYIAGTNFAPLVALTMKIKKSVLRLASFTSYRNPNIFEHSMHYEQFSGSAKKQTVLDPNGDLKAEKTINFELGIRSNITSNLYFSTDLYYNKTTNGIEWTLTGSETLEVLVPVYQSINSLSQDVAGVEMVLKYAFLDYFNLENNMTLTNIVNTSSDLDYTSEANGVGQGRYGENYFAPLIYNAILRFDYKKWHVNTHFQYVGGHTWQWPSWKSDTETDNLSLKEVDAYANLNLYLGYDLMDNLSISVEGLNLIDQSHTEWRAEKSYFGRMMWARVKFRLP